MAAHTMESRFRTIRREVPDTAGIPWTGTDVEFMELMIQFSRDLPEGGELDAFKRYYLEGGTRRHSAETGRPLREDSRFYQYLCSSRLAFTVYYILTMKARAYGRN